MRAWCVVVGMLLVGCGGSTPVVEQDGGTDAGADAGNGDAGGVYATTPFAFLGGSHQPNYSFGFSVSSIAAQFRDAGTDVFAHANVTITAATIQALLNDGGVGDFLEVDAGTIVYSIGQVQLAHAQFPSDAGTVAFTVDSQPNLADGFGDITFKTQTGPNGAGVAYEGSITFHGSP